MARYEVMVGNIGTVYSGTGTYAHAASIAAYKNYVAFSNMPHGRASGEEVTLFEDGEPVMQHMPESPTPTVSNTELETWFERDRAFVGLKYTDSDEYLLEVWDECINEAVEDGFLSSKGFIMGRMIDESYLHASAVEWFNNLVKQGCTVPIVMKPCEEEEEEESE